MEQCAKNWRSSSLEVDLYCADWVGKVDPDGTAVTQEIAEGAQYLMDDLLATCNEYGGYRYLLIEQRVHMTRIHPTENWGTLDLAIYNPDRKVLILWDLKFGHSLVRAKGNLQLIDYVEGLHEAMAIPLDTEVHLRICQPFAYAPWGPTDSHVCQLSDLVPAFQQLATKAQEATHAPTMSAGAWCRYCPARVDCATARQHLYLWGSLLDMPYQLDVMSLDDKAREIDLIKDVERVSKSRREALEDTLQADMHAGKVCNVKAYESTPGRLNWDEGKEAAAIAAFKSLGLDVESHKPITPTQALQKVPKEHREVATAMIKGLATRKMISKLVDREDSIVSHAFGAK